MTGAAPAERALQPLDELRGLVLRALPVDWPLARAIVARRSVRVPVLLSLHAAAALVLAVLAPSFLLAVGPLALGVPHLAADVRHLLTRRATPRWWLAASAGFALVLIALRALAEGGARWMSLPAEHALAAAWVLLGAAGGAAAGAAARVARPGEAEPRRQWTARGWTALMAAATLAAFAIGAPRAFRMALLHGHNLVAVVIWVCLFGRGWRFAWVPVAIVLAGAAALASGIAVGITVRHGALSVFGVHLFAAADWLAPGLSDARALAVAMSFAFLQSVHYAIWLVGIPAADRPGEGGRAWRTAWRDLRRDLRPAGAAVVVALTLLVALLGLAHAAPTRRLFLSLATFHGWLELAVLAYLFGRGSARVPATVAGAETRPVA
jgi:hypothetical protein